ncbi:MAG TPA: hypothetical protein VG298_00725 [Acidimicrobiales bacterium]|nr:hypothetical protein [Acidimicrobiales bacterium]
MCDTLCGRGPDGLVFAKNSDRPVGEVQLAAPFGRRPTAGCTLRTQYLRIGDTGAHATFLSCPTWLWGAEHGVNEYGVAIGNERVSTVHAVAAARPSLIGMDLVRLGLERARSADEALHIMTELLSTHGQGGIADAVHGEAYDSSFLIADPAGAFVLDTSGRHYAAAPFPDGTAISNRLSLRTDWTLGSPDLEAGEDFDRFRDADARTGSADVRLDASRRFLQAHGDGQLTPAATAAHLRDHGHGPWGAPGTGSGAAPTTGPTTGPTTASALPHLPPAGVPPDVTGISVCMHVAARSVTAASLIAVLPTELLAGAPLRAYVALGSPCASIFVPAFPFTVAGPPPFVPFELSTEAMWRSADALRQLVESDPAALGAVRAVLGPVEDELWQEADDVAEHPDRWRDVGLSWGPRAVSALQHALV